MGLRKIQMAVTSVLLLGIGLTGFAQETNEQQQNLNREMTLEREYDPIVQDAAKVTTLPPIREIIITKRPITYSDYAVPLLPEKEMNILPPGTMMTDVEHSKRNGYLHLGGGMLLNLMGDFGYHLLNTDRDRLGISLSHRSTNGNVKFEDDVFGPRKAQFNDNLGGLDFKHLFKIATLTLGGSYGYSMFNYYGFPTNNLPYTPAFSSYFDPSDPYACALRFSILGYDTVTNQANRHINAYGGISSDSPDFLGYHIGVEYTNFNQKYSLNKELDGVTENHIGVNLGLRSRVNDGKSFGVDVKANMLSYTAPMLPYYEPYSPVSSALLSPLIVVDSTAFDRHINATLTPYFRIESDTWKMLLGANLMLVSQNGETNVYASPNITLDVPFAKFSEFYARLEGGIESNSMAELSRVNRYVNPAFTADASKTWADLKIGVRSAAAAGFWFDIFAGYKYTESDVFFNPSFYNWINDGFNNVSMVFQPTSQRYQAGATLKYDYMHVVDFYLKGVYNYYDLKYTETWKNGYAVRSPDENSELKPYGKPVFTGNAGINVRPVKPLTLCLDYCMMSGLYAKNGYIPVEMKNIHDLRFRPSWKFNDTFSLYLQFNNLLFQQQSLYYGYPLQPFSAMAGLNVNF